MNSAPETAPGQLRGWSLLEKIGEGDAGEVFRVESLIDHKPAVLKRPLREAFPSDIIRQARQIEKEASILSALMSIESPARMMHAPSIYDRSRSGTEYTERFFIIISPAPGLNISQLARLVQYQSEPFDPEYAAAIKSFSSEEKFLLDGLVKMGQVPQLLLLRLVSGLIEYLESIHSLQLELNTGPVYGLVWNDIKPEHIYWDPSVLRFTLIDWGNGQFVDADGISKDRLLSRMGDYSQFISEIGGLLLATHPQFLKDLEWPENASLPNIYTSGIIPVKEKALSLQQSLLLERRKLRRIEADLTSRSSPVMDNIEELDGIQQEIIRLGELPDFKAALLLYQNVAKSLLDAPDLSQFADVCARLENTPLADNTRYHLLPGLVQIVAEGILPRDILSHALDGKWAEVHWQARLAALLKPEPAWWEELSNSIRDLEIGSSVLRPFVAVNRLVHAIQLAGNRNAGDIDLDGLLRTIQENLLPRWRQLEPDPPDSGIEYRDAETCLRSAALVLPEAGKVTMNALSQAQSQIQICLDAWERRDFESARSALRRALLWDPDRLRFIQADRALQNATTWMDEVHGGLIHDEPLTDFITRLELVGRELRNQIAPAEWLDHLLEAFKQIRKGADLTDVLVQQPEVLSDLDWLISLEPRRPLMASAGKELLIERKKIQEIINPTLNGICEEEFGVKKGIVLGEPLDTWVSEARGSSARMFAASVPSISDERIKAALKIMRPNRVDYALPLFREEAHILSLLRDVEGVIPLIETGFIKIDRNSLPSEDSLTPADDLKGQTIRYGLDSIHNFLTDLETRVAEGWLPYLAEVKYKHQDNLLLCSDTGYTNGKFLPTLDGLIMAIQICGILEAAHARSIIYRDHKILHYYWLEEYNGIFMIDWNVAKRFPQGLSALETQFDLVQFGARALHYILTGRSAQGALPLGPNKPEEIEAAARTYAVSWTYDDQRLPKDIKEVLEAVLSGYYQSARQLKEDLTSIYEKLLLLV